ncbi:hypothetical protein HY250_02510 [Candidatus Azambacteria bacterium]|nr:hypothetical protein [Candidatus Azambacteria bacterium]MBI3685253.1 hypothetical protein [Candidatus Azambacteria bacterium]
MYAQPKENKSGVDGSGVLAVLKALVHKAGITTIEVIQVKLIRPDGSLIDFTFSDLNINIEMPKR